MFHTLNPFLSNRVPVLVEVGRELDDPEPHQLYVRARVGLLRVCVCQSLEDADRVIASGTHPSSAWSPLAGGCTGHERGKSGWLPAVNLFQNVRLQHIFVCHHASGLDIKLVDAVARGASRFENLLAPLKTYWPPPKTNWPLPRVYFITLSMHHSHHTSSIMHFMP